MAIEVERSFSYNTTLFLWCNLFFFPSKNVLAISQRAVCTSKLAIRLALCFYFGKRDCLPKAMHRAQPLV